MEAKKRSDDIDEQIRVEKAEMRRRRQEIKILLLGQSESGKSTTLKRECCILLKYCNPSDLDSNHRISAAAHAKCVLR